ncbi:MAG: endolytic transglycosylase MltG [Gallionellaceae bacterium]|nr:endolytic transglycosylase MltG [Gallionellaceae bacterium]
MLKRLFLLCFLTALAAIAWLLWYATTPMVGGRVDYPVAFSVERGGTLKSAARDMAQAGVLQQPWAFVMLGRLKGAAAEIKAGSYALNAPITPLGMLRKITVGDTVLGKLTVPEGWSFAEMRGALDAHPGLRHDTAGMDEVALLRAIGADVAHAEGRFFPDTYFFDLGSSELALYKRAYSAMREQLDAAWAARAPGLPYRTPDDALTMASIIEKETGAPEERPRIASVFINRLKIGMRLQTDPTVIYGLGERFDGNLRKDDLLADNPYNTYTRAGLPPTPIALPGAAALRAAVNPARSRALYFVAKGQGRHEFSDNLDAHNRAVNRYQRGR